MSNYTQSRIRNLINVVGKSMKIKEVIIKNFRSIRSLTLTTRDLNILVGFNDVGKSNILRALNLFFNDQTDNGVNYDFKKDFTYLFPPKAILLRRLKSSYDLMFQFLIKNQV